MDDKFKKNLTLDEFGEFAQHFPISSISIVDLHKVPKLLTASEDLQQKTRLVRIASGAETGMTLRIYRYDKQDDAIETPINVDLYVIDNNLRLLKRPLPTSEHRLTSGSFALIREINKL